MSGNGLPPGGMYAVWVQPITNDTSPGNVAKYGEVTSLEDIVSSNDNPLSCGGATSPTGPRYADDQMGMLWFYSESAAQYASGVLREDILLRQSTGRLQLAQTPPWFNNVAAASLASIPALRDDMRDKLGLDQDITDSQLDTALELYIIETGNDSPTPAEFNRWLARHRDWARPLWNR